MQTPIARQVQATFKECYGQSPTLLIRAPGRVNLIGEHTDYNDGFVMPLAIDKGIWIAASPINEDVVHLHSLVMDSAVKLSTQSFDAPADDWGIYVQGVAWVLRKHGIDLRGWQGVVGSDLPIGSGLSSSAALELAVARCFVALNNEPWDPIMMAKYCQEAENAWVGMQCGIMDQLIVAAGQEGHALLIDCRSLALKPAALPDGSAVVIMDTATRRGLVDSKYNERRAQCEEAASFFGVSILRDVPSASFAERAAELDPLLRMRCRHVVMENQRTLDAYAAMQANDASLLGKLMDQSHDSLRDDYEVTNKGLDVMVEIARKQPGVFGARMTGGGFGGCAIALVVQDSAQAFVDAVHTEYANVMGLTPSFYICHPTAGTDLVVINA